MFEAYTEYQPATREAMDTSRKEVRILPRVNRPRKKVRDVEGETATCVKASIALTVGGEVNGVPPGYVAVACIKRSVYELGRPARLPAKGSDSQLTEGITMGIKWQESDLFIVLRDGKTDHMGKEQTVRLSEHSTHPIENACLVLIRMSRSLPKC